MKKKLLFLPSLVLLLSFGLLIGNVHARGGLYKIEPHGKHIETIRLSVSDEVYGNFFINFYYCFHKFLHSLFLTTALHDL
ncbi:MAG: hypothetical protein QXE76_07285 [Candidatus Bathyarchaeia archaeon]